MTRRPAALHPVALVTRWDGYCLPCGSDARPLALTWTGRRGLRAWLAGEGWHDGELRLTCACCGGVDVVGWEDEPELLVEDEDEDEVTHEVADEVEVADEPARESASTAPAAAPVSVVRVVDLDAPAAGLHGLVPVQRAGTTPAGAPDADALDLLGLVG